MCIFEGAGEGSLIVRLDLFSTPFKKGKRAFDIGFFSNLGSLSYFLSPGTDPAGGPD